jgi:hypothetical protein
MRIPSRRLVKRDLQLATGATLEQLKGNLPWAPGAIFHDASATVSSELGSRHLMAFEPELPELRLETTLTTGQVVRWLQLRSTEDR